MSQFRVGLLVAWAVAVGFASSPAPAQDPVKRAEALEKLLEKLDDPKPSPAGTADPNKKPDPKPAPAPESGKKDDALEKLLEKLDGPKPSDPGKAESKKPGEVASPDQSLDKLLEGLGGVNDKPSPDDKKQGGSGTPPGDPPPPGPGGESAKSDPLDSNSKKLDDLLEEKTGRKPKKKPNQGQGQGQGQGGGEGDDQGEAGGPLGDLIKQMREVEDRLGKPDTGAETRQKQTEIVKKLDSVLEQMRSSSGQSRGLKMVRGGQKPSGPPQPGQGNQPGATAQGVGASKPTPPKTPPAPVEVAKAVWGQLPDQFRDDMSNVLNEVALPSKANIIRLYYLSLGKKSTAKGE